MKLHKLHLRTEDHDKHLTLEDPLPHPVVHDHDQCQIIRINVAGLIFETQKRTLNQFPDTLLGNPGRMIQFFDPTNNEYFFDRNRTCFEAIIYYYQTGGVLRRPFNVSPDMFLDEVKFFDLGNEAVKKYQSDEGFLFDEVKELPKNLLQRKIWLLFEYPESSFQSRIVAILSVLVIIDSIMMFCLETLEVFSLAGHTSEKEHGSDHENAEYSEDEAVSLSDPFYIVETACVCWFFFEFVMRMITCPKKCQFFQGVTNLIDMVAIAPYFVGIIIGGNTPNNKEGGGGGSGTSETAKDTLTLLRIIRLVRVLRILKLSRHNRGLKILGLTLKASFRELGLLIVFLLIAIIVFSSAVYFAEARFPGGGHPGFSSVPESFWWAVCTMTTRELHRIKILIIIIVWVS